MGSSPSCLSGSSVDDDLPSNSKVSADQPPKQGPFQLGGKQLSRNGSRGRHGTPLPSNDLDAYSAFIDNSDAVETAQQVTVAISDYGAILKTTERLGDIVKVKKLGAGGYGVVWLCERRGPTVGPRREPRQFALKELCSGTPFRPGVDSSLKDHLPLDEAAIQRYMRHPHVVATYWADVRVLDPVSLKPLNIGAQDLLEGQWTSLDKVDDLERTYTSAFAARGMPRTKNPEVKLQMRIAMEVADLGSLREYLTTKPEQRLPISVSISQNKRGKTIPADYCAMLTALDIAEALKYMHKNRILHSDLKPMNILIVSDKMDRDKGFRAKLSDFGLSARLHQGQDNVPITNGTIAYLPKDAFEHMSASEATDIYAFGLILWEVWYGIWWGSVHETERRRRKATTHADMYDYKPLCGPDCPPAYAELVHNCLDSDPLKRPNAKALVKSLVTMSSALVAESHRA